MVEEELIFDLNVEDYVYVLKNENADVTDPDSYVKYDGPMNREEFLALNPIEPDPDTPEGTIDAKTIQGLFFTVQIGVYSRDVERKHLYNLKPIVTLKTNNDLFRYSTGTVEPVESAAVRKDQIVGIGITDAFVTAYYNGERITIARARSILNGGQ